MRVPSCFSHATETLGSSSSRGSGRSQAVVFQRRPGRTTSACVSARRPLASVVSSSGNQRAGVITRPVST